MSVAANKSLSAAVGAGAFDWSSSTGTFATATGNNVLNGNVSIASGKSVSSTGGATDFNFASSSGNFTTSTGDNLLSGNVSVAANKSLSAAAGAGAFDWSNSTGSFETSSGPMTINSNTTEIVGTVQFDNTITAQPASSFAINLSNTSGAFTTSTGVNTLAGNVVLASNKSLTVGTSSSGAVDFSNSSGSFTTSTGTNTLSGDTYIASGKTFRSIGGVSGLDFSASIGAFKTTGGTTTIQGPMICTNPVQLDAAIVCNSNSSGIVDFSGSSGSFKTTTGTSTIMGPLVANSTVQLNGNVSAQAASALNVDFSNSSGLFKTSTGVVTIGDSTGGSNAINIGVGSYAGTITLGNSLANVVISSGNISSNSAVSLTNTFQVTGAQSTFRSSTGSSGIAMNVTNAAGGGINYGILVNDTPTSSTGGAGVVIFGGTSGVARPSLKIDNLFGVSGGVGAEIRARDSDSYALNITAGKVGFVGMNLTSTGSLMTIDGNMTVTGNFIVQGSTTTVNSTIVTIQDPMIEIASNNDLVPDSVSAGIYMPYVSGNTTLYQGVARIVSSDAWAFFKSSVDPSTTPALPTANATNTANITAHSAVFWGDLQVNGNSIVPAAVAGSYTLTSALLPSNPIDIEYFNLATVRKSVSTSGTTPTTLAQFDYASPSTISCISYDVVANSLSAAGGGVGAVFSGKVYVAIADDGTVSVTLLPVTQAVATALDGATVSASSTGSQTVVLSVTGVAATNIIWGGTFNITAQGNT